MNIKPTYQLVSKAIAESQDGKKLNPSDEYSSLLLTLLNNNTEKNIVNIDAGEVDTEELADNIKYAISEFKRALKAVESFN